jgi:hypothetical protein
MTQNCLFSVARAVVQWVVWFNALDINVRRAEKQVNKECTDIRKLKRSLQSFKHYCLWCNKSLRLANTGDGFFSLFCIFRRFNKNCE